VIDVQVPNTMTLKVVATDPGLKGNTAKGGGMKPAVLESGATVMVPLFVEVGELIKVNTEMAEYLGREGKGEGKK
jgi:elongation factor P